MSRAGASCNLSLIEKWARIKKSGYFKRKLLVKHTRSTNNIIFRCFVNSQSASTKKQVQEHIKTNEENVILDVNNSLKDHGK